MFVCLVKRGERQHLAGTRGYGRQSDLPSTNNILRFAIVTSRIPHEIKVNGRTVKENATNEKLLWKHNKEKKKLEIFVVKPEFPLELQIDYQ